LSVQIAANFEDRHADSSSPEFDQFNKEHGNVIAAQTIASDEGNTYNVTRVTFDVLRQVIVDERA